MAVAKKEEEEEEKRKNKKQRFDEPPHGSMSNLPFDLVMEILPRLPIKSLLRLKLASKPLSPLISDHLRRRYSLPNAVSGLFFAHPISTNFYHALNSNSKLMDGKVATLPPITEILDCCNGLLLCQRKYINNINRGVTVSSFVCNPLTGQWVSISILNSVSLSFGAVLAFDPRVSGHYNILCFRTRVVHVFSSETGSWVEKKQWTSHNPVVFYGRPFFFNGKVYFPSVRYPFVKIFDSQGRFLGRINLPYPQMGTGRRLLGHSGGHLHFAIKVNVEMLVWIREDCDESLWVLKHRVSLQSIFDAVSVSGSGSGSSAWNRILDYPQAFHPNMDLVFVQVNGKLFSYNMDNGDLVEICTNNMQNQSIFVYSPCYSKDFDL